MYDVKKWKDMKNEMETEPNVRTLSDIFTLLIQLVIQKQKNTDSDD